MLHAMRKTIYWKALFTPNSTLHDFCCVVLMCNSRSINSQTTQITSCKTGQSLDDAISMKLLTRQSLKVKSRNVMEFPHTHLVVQMCTSGCTSGWPDEYISSTT